MKAHSAFVERWRPAVVDDSGTTVETCLVSDQGRIVSGTPTELMKLYMVGGREGSRYHMAHIYTPEKRHAQLLHRIVARTFTSLPPVERAEVNHINADKLDNRLENLEWCNRKQNMGHASRNGLLDRNVKLTDEAVRIIRTGAEPDKVYAARFGVRRETVCRTRNMKIHKHVV